MNTKFTLFLLAVVLGSSIRSQEKEVYKIQTIAFYNLENLFDYEDDPKTFDDDRTPEGKDHWTENNYTDKLKNMASVLSKIGAETTGTPPTVIGVCEVENRRVLDDLINQESLIQKDYGVIHFDSPDRRGIDVAFLYQKRLFTPTHYRTYELRLFEENDPAKRIYTRDQLVVSGSLDGERFHFIVNHWPSRSGGEAKSRFKRMKAAALNRQIIDSIFSNDPYAKIISMGDLNDDPVSPSMIEVLKTKKDKKEMGLKQLYNPMFQMYQDGMGTLAYGDHWNLFDQIIVSSELTRSEYTTYQFYKAGIFNQTYLMNQKGRYKGYPFRSFADGQFTGGYSDHFPVYLYLIKRITNKR